MRFSADCSFHIGAQHLRSGLPCEDYALARETLTRFEALPEAEKKPAEVADYVSVIAALEDEIAADLRNARRFAGET